MFTFLIITTGLLHAAIHLLEYANHQELYMNRNLYIILLWIFSLQPLFANEEYPSNALFQVLTSNNSTYSDGRKLERFDFLYADDTILIPQFDSLFLLHKSGLPLRFTDTVVSIKVLNTTILDRQANIDNPYSIFSNFDLRLLADSLRWEQKYGIKNSYKNLVVVGYVSCGEQIFMTCPYFYIKKRTSISGALELQWNCTHTQPDSFLVELTSLYGDSLYTSKVSENIFRLDSSMVQEILAEHSNFVVNIKSMTYRYSGSFLIESPKTKLPVLELACQSQDPNAQVLLGLYNEFGGKYDFALKTTI